MEREDLNRSCACELWLCWRELWIVEQCLLSGGGTGSPFIDVDDYSKLDGLPEWKSMHGLHTPGDRLR